MAIRMVVLREAMDRRRIWTSACQKNKIWHWPYRGVRVDEASNPGPPGLRRRTEEEQMRREEELFGSDDDGVDPRPIPYGLPVPLAPTNND